MDRFCCTHTHTCLSPAQRKESTVSYRHSHRPRSRTGSYSCTIRVGCVCTYTCTCLYQNSGSLGSHMAHRCTCKCVDRTCSGDHKLVDPYICICKYHSQNIVLHSTSPLTYTGKSKMSYYSIGSLDKVCGLYTCSCRSRSHSTLQRHIS